MRSHPKSRKQKVEQAKRERLALKEASARLSWLRSLTLTELIESGLDSESLRVEKGKCMKVIFDYNSTFGEY